MTEFFGEQTPPQDPPAEGGTPAEAPGSADQGPSPEATNAGDPPPAVPDPEPSSPSQAEAYGDEVRAVPVAEPDVADDPNPDYNPFSAGYIEKD